MIKPYKRALAEAYAPGTYTTRELLLSRPETVRAVYVHPACDAWTEVMYHRRSRWLEKAL